MTMQRIREVYGVPAKRGRRVTVNGTPGVITSADRSTMHLRVRFDGDTQSVRVHPTWRVDYSPFAPPADPEPVECEHCCGSGNTKVHVKGATVDAPCTPCAGGGRAS